MTGGAGITLGSKGQVIAWPGHPVVSAGEARPRPVLVGILPLATGAFLAWVVVKSLQIAPVSRRWSVIGIASAGLVLMLVARFVLWPAFLHIARESAPRNAG